MQNAIVSTVAGRWSRRLEGLRQGRGRQAPGDGCRRLGDRADDARGYDRPDRFIEADTSTTEGAEAVAASHRRERQARHRGPRGRRFVDAAWWIRGHHRGPVARRAEPELPRGGAARSSAPPAMIESGSGVVLHFGSIQREMPSTTPRCPTRRRRPRYARTAKASRTSWRPAGCGSTPSARAGSRRRPTRTSWTPSRTATG